MKPHTFAICAFKDSPYLEACIRSLLAQTVPSDIILCTSTPSPYISGLVDRYHIPLFVREGTSDIQDDWNFAYQMAEGRYVTIAHQDDLYQKRYVEYLLDYAARYPDMTVFTSDYVTVQKDRLPGKGKVERIKTLLRFPLRLPACNHLRVIKKSVLIMGNSICCPSCAYHKELIPGQLFTSSFKYALDWDTLFKLADLPGRFICVEKPLLYYRIHDGAATKACIENNRRITEETAMFAKFWPKPMVLLILRHYRKAAEVYK